MMMLEEARNTRENLLRLVEAKQNVDEARSLAEKKDKLNDLVDKVQFLSTRRSILQKGGVILPLAPDVGNTKKMCSTILTQFMESPTHITLIENKRWVKFTETLSKFTASEENLQKAAWKKYSSSNLFGGLPPEKRQETILSTLPENERAMQRYRELYGELAHYRDSIPGSAEELDKVQTCSNKLSKIQFIENDDVPESVRKFFKATSSGANLDLLTPEVIGWLRTNNMLNNYVVRTRD